VSAVPRKKKLGELLVEKGLITEDHLRIALMEQKKSNAPLGKLFVQLGFATESIIRDVLGEAIGQESVDLSRIVIDADALKMIDKDVARRYSILPITFDRTRQTLTVAMSDTLNVVAMDQLHSLLGGDIDIQPLLAGENEIINAIDHFYGYELSVDGVLNELETGEIDTQSMQVANFEYSHPLVRLVDGILSDAVKRGASDIHFEPEQGFIRIRYRIDGVLRQMRNLHKSYWSAIAVRLKILANMNIAEMRMPQDGRISLTISGRDVDFRVASQPTTHGENIVIRVLDREKGIVPLASLGLAEETAKQLQLMMARPEGIILVTGPTGSGKTTTLYSMLNSINSDKVNIMTLEDPVEYPMTMIRQTSVNEAAKLDFANGIRSMMRQDPDIILVGEIRDEDTADMAFRAAMTGHQVYSTLHTNSALGVVPRLLDIGIKPHIMAGNIIGVVAQRLVRKLCPHCKQAYQPQSIERRLLNLPDHETVTLYRHQGCGQCEHAGYKGRLALMEVLRLNMDVDELIARGASMREIQACAIEHGFQLITVDAARRVLEGITSLEEVTRVVDLTQRL